MPDLLDPLASAGSAESLIGDEVWLRACIEVEVALVHALASQQLVSPGSTEIADGLIHAKIDVEIIAMAGRGGGNPIIPLVRALGKLADAATAGASDDLHVGATSQDILDTAAMVIARRVIVQVDRDLASTIRLLARLAELHRGTPMAGRTLGQHASPMTFGLVVSSWLGGLLAARAQLASVASRLPVQYGGAVGSRAILREIAAQRRPDADADELVASVSASLASRLGLRDATPWQSNRMPVVELGSALAAVVGAIGAMAADINVLSRTEIAEVSERLGAGEGGSSAMPHKRNPVTSVLLVSAATRSPGLVATLFAAQVTEDQRSTGAWHAEWQTLRELERIAIEASSTAADLSERLEIDVTRMRANLDYTAGLIYSERVSAILAGSMGKDMAFEFVEASSRESIRTDRPLQVVIAGRLAGNHDGALRSRVLAAFDPNFGLEASAAIVDAVLMRAKEIG